MKQIRKYFIMQNIEPKQQELYYDIVNFLWDNGNVVYSKQYYTEEVQQIISYCDWLVVIDNRSTSFRDAQKVFLDELNLKIFKNKHFLIFMNDGVYTDAIPSPHKIFHLNGLNKKELELFFDWCNRLNLFQQPLIKAI